jgi:hypothetical protein
MASYGIPTQYMHGTNREACLERAVQVRARDLDERLHLLLLDLTLRTAYQEEAIAKELNKLTSKLQELLAAAAEQVGRVAVLHAGIGSDRPMPHACVGAPSCLQLSVCVPLRQCCWCFTLPVVHDRYCKGDTTAKCMWWSAMYQCG